MATEKKTDFWVMNELINKGYTNANLDEIRRGVHVWAEVAKFNKIKELFQNASKSKSGNIGRPEFIIYDENNKVLIIIENKRDINKHIYEQNIEQKVSEYAVNGVLWYASHTKDDYDTIAIAVSGTDKDNMKIDTYAWKKGVETFSNLNIHEILPIADYIDVINETTVSESDISQQLSLLEEARKINEFMHNAMNIIEHNRLYVLGSILFALEDPIFKTGYSQYNNNNDIATILWNTLERKIRGSSIDDKELLINELKPTIMSLASEEKEGVRGRYSKGTLHKLISDVDRILYKHYEDSELDLISLFFNVFLSYTTKGGSGLGIVLTPTHITRLFIDIAKVDINSKILDPCVGTGGFLTSAWRKIALSDKYTYTEKEDFKKNNLFGVEIEPSVFTVVALNMFLNKDGQSHLMKGDCFSLKDEMSNHHCNVGFLNPPYSNELYSEISFVELMLDSLLPNSIGIAIVPVNAVSARTKKHNDNNVYKKRILEKHKLIASIEMPKNLFYPKGTETIVLVFETGKSNKNNKTWFAKFDDGYQLIKHQKSRTKGENSDELYENFIDAYNKKEETDFSLLAEVDYTDQWVYTLFSDEEYEVGIDDLQKTTNEYISYLFKNQYL